jgi:hypothetical protein
MMKKLSIALLTMIFLVSGILHFTHDSELVKIIAVGSLGKSEYYFHGEGENSGTPYTIWYEDIDLRSDKFYKLVEVVS